MFNDTHPTAAEHIIRFYGHLMDKAIAQHYLLQAVDQRLEKALPQIAQDAANIVSNNFDVMVLKKATPQIKQLEKEINDMLGGKQ